MIIQLILTNVVHEFISNYSTYVYIQKYEATYVKQ